MTWPLSGDISLLELKSQIQTLHLSYILFKRALITIYANTFQICFCSSNLFPQLNLYNGNHLHNYLYGCSMDTSNSTCFKLKCSLPQKWKIVSSSILVSLFSSSCVYFSFNSLTLKNVHLLLLLTPVPLCLD